MAVGSQHRGSCRPLSFPSAVSTASATHCRIHGGSAPQVQRKARELVAQAIIERHAHHYGEPRNISAVDAPTEELHRPQGHVDWLGEQVAARPQDASFLAVYAAEGGHLAKLAGQIVSGASSTSSDVS